MKSLSRIRRPAARLALLFCLSLSTVWPATPAEKAAVDGGEVFNVYPYRMKGKVRLLFFWVGKDDVGGGHIAIGRTLEGSDGWRQEIEVLFGSNPERVPGKINRWGYGREESVWTEPAPSSGPRLVRTLFEGFMKHSKEESLSEVQSNSAAENGSFVYDGIRSLVGPEEALSEIRTFAAGEDFDYRNSDPIHCGYKKRLAGGPPDKSRKLTKREGYQAPFGFLTGVNSMLQGAVKAYGAGGDWMSQRPTLVYVYNAQKYQLRLKNLKFEGDFDIPLPRKDGEREREQRFRQVAKAEFEIKKLGTDYDHEFNIWFPLEGRYRGVPIRIEDKPRWWLRIELNLDPTRTASYSAAERQSARLRSCE